MNEHITHEQVEAAYIPARETIAKLPDSIESREAQRLLKLSEQVAHVAREKAPNPNGE